MVPHPPWHPIEKVNPLLGNALTADSRGCAVTNTPNDGNQLGLIKHDLLSVTSRQEKIAFISKATRCKPARWLRKQIRASR